MAEGKEPGQSGSNDSEANTQIQKFIEGFKDVSSFSQVSTLFSIQRNILKGMYW